MTRSCQHKPSPLVPTVKVPTCAELAEALKNFKPTVPLSFIVAARRAARNR